MKKNIIIAAIAAAAALLLCASCQKQELIEQNNGINASGKTFTATIEGLTKTTITDEYKVNWDQGDLIDIKGGTTYSATPDASDATKASLTKVSGSDPTPDYTAVYPASLFKNSGYELPATQTYAAGKFNAPMCAMSSTESLEFKNFCGVLCFALKGTDMVKSIAVTANEQLCGPFEFADATSFSFSGENEGYTVTLDCGEGVQLSATDSTNFYISLPPATYTAGMKIVITNTEGKTIEKTTTTAVKIERNNLYTFDWTATFAPTIVSVQLWKDGPYFATCNVGAEKPEDAGYYFWWGDTVGYRHDGEKWVSADGKGTTIEFSEDELPANMLFGKDAAALADYVDANGNLKSDYDAATAHLGAPWRMPTYAELKGLVDECDRLAINTSGTEYKGDGDTFVGWRVTGRGDYSGNSIFLPAAAGIGNGSDLSQAGMRSEYWSSTPCSDMSNCAWEIALHSSKFSDDYTWRCYGVSVRAVRDAAKPLPAGALKGEFSVSATKKVHFSQGNLVATINDSGAPTAWKFATNQYDYLGVGGANKKIGTAAGDVDLFGWSTASTTYGISKSQTAGDYSGDFVDWGEAYCEKNSITPNNTWRTLSKDEWTYLFNTRTASTVNGTANARYAKATVNSKAGVILLPDTYAHPEGVTDFTSINTADAAFTDNTYDLTNWEKMETAGAVFLPAAGYRDGSDVEDNVSGNYWLSTATDGSYAYNGIFDSARISLPDDERYYGCSVRLITDAPQPK